jgi:hypothetical protein
MSFNSESLAAIHARLIDGDPTASSDLFELLYSPLIGHAIKKHASFGVDQDRASDLAVKVLADLIEHPQIFDPAKGNLFGFLCMAIDGDASNAGRDAANRRELFSGFAVEVEHVGGNTYLTSPETLIDAGRIMQRFGKDIIVDAGDQEVLKLILQEERDYGPYASALGLDHLPPAERNAEVKRRKDRIEKRLERLKDRL